MDSILVQVGCGVALAACAGLRAFLPLLAAGLAARFEVLPFAARYDWLATDPALVVLGVAVVLEIAADKIPLVDHALDWIEMVVKPAAGTALAVGALSGLDTLPATVVGLVTGGGVAATVQVVEAKLRLASTLATVGLFNPVLSIVEDALALVLSIAAVLVPLLLLVLLGLAAAAAVAIAVLVRRRVPAPSR